MSRKVDQLAGLISTVHRSLSGLGKNAPAPAPLVPAVPIRPLLAIAVFPLDPHRASRDACTAKPGVWG